MYTVDPIPHTPYRMYTVDPIPLVQCSPLSTPTFPASRDCVGKSPAPEAVAGSVDRSLGSPEVRSSGSPGSGLRTHVWLCGSTRLVRRRLPAPPLKRSETFFCLT